MRGDAPLGRTREALGWRLAGLLLVVWVYCALGIAVHMTSDAAPGRMQREVGLLDAGWCLCVCVVRAVTFLPVRDAS